jgi:hypothetical protein
MINKPSSVLLKYNFKFRQIQETYTNHFPERGKREPELKRLFNRNVSNRTQPMNGLANPTETLTNIFIKVLLAIN